MAASTETWKKHRSVWLLLGLSIIAVYVVVPQIGSLHNSWHLIASAKVSWVLVALALTFLTYFSAAGIYRSLAFEKLRYAQVLLVQLAAMFVNRLLPAGIGALGSNFSYLKRHRHSSTQAATVVGCNNLLGIIGHILILITLVILSSGHVNSDNLQAKSSAEKLLVVIALAVVLLAIAIVVGKNRLRSFWKDLKTQLVSYRSRPGSVLSALVFSLSLTLANILCLVACAHALHISLSLVDTALVFTLGVGAASAVPTPGGLGGFEAGLFAGFVAYGVPDSSALALALLYRLVSYWVPLLVGLPALIVCQKQKLF